MAGKRTAGRPRTRRSQLHTPSRTLAQLAVTIVVAVVLISPAWGGDADAGARPGDTVNGALLAAGFRTEHETPLWAFCDPDQHGSPTFTRSCRAIDYPIERLFIGDFLITAPGELNSVWRTLHWQLWLDGQKIDLPAFGTDDLGPFTPHGGTKVLKVRQWKVILVHPKAGRHTLHEIVRRAIPGKPSELAQDGTWTFVLPKR